MVGRTTPWSYTAAVVPVLLGASIAAFDGVFQLWPLLLALIARLQSRRHQPDERLFRLPQGGRRAGHAEPGGSIVLVSLRPGSLHGRLLAFGIGIAIGLYLVSITDRSSSGLVVFSVLVASSTRRGLSRWRTWLGRGGGLYLHGPVMVIGSYYVQAQTVTLPVVLLHYL